MAETKRKGDVGEMMAVADVLRRGYKVALPVGEDWRFDVIALREGRLERLQCKYVASDGQVIKVPCRSANNWSIRKYTSDDFDWLVVFDQTSDKCYYLPSSLLGDGRSTINLRLVPSKNGQSKGILWARDYEDW
jgi:PD-(D/E)XK endonuclease